MLPVRLARRAGVKFHILLIQRIELVIFSFSFNTKNLKKKNVNFKMGEE